MADKAFDNKEYFQCYRALIKKLTQKQKEKKTKRLSFSEQRNVYRMINDNKQAEAWYTKAIKANYTDPESGIVSC